MVECGVIRNTDLRKIVEQLCRASQMKRVAVREQQAGKAVYPRPVQILTDDPLISPLVTAIEQPVRPSALLPNDFPS
jgi:hypothetical protein